jgi:hypothetical protein
MNKRWIPDPVVDRHTATAPLQGTDGEEGKNCILALPFNE